MQGERIPFAIRIRENTEPEPIRETSHIAPAPELGGMLHNIVLYGGLKCEAVPLRKRELIGGIKAKLRVEVWQTVGGVKKRLAETWWATKVPKGHETLEHFIGAYLVEEARQLSAQADKLNSPITAEKSVGEIVDIREATKQAIAELLRCDYPQFFRAYDNHLSADERRKAYIADLTANMGRGPDADGSLLQDTSFVKWLAAALAKLAKADWKVSAVDWEIAGGWIPRGYYKMRPEELTRELNTRTGMNLSAEAWRKRIAALQLPNIFTAGRKEHVPPPSL